MNEQQRATMQAALDALKCAAQGDASDCEYAIALLRAALAEQDAETQPNRYLIRYNDDGEFGQATGWLYRSGGGPCVVTGKPVYVWSPLRDLIVSPRREWMTLTDEEMATTFLANHWQRDSVLPICRAIEAALKEKNRD